MPLNLSNLSLPIKFLFSGYLLVVAIGYGLTVAQILLHRGVADGKFGLSLNDIAYRHYGSRPASVLESKVNGSMGNESPADARSKIIHCVRKGSEQSTHDAQIKQRFEEYYQDGHELQNGLANSPQFGDIQGRTRSDEGVTSSSLIQVFHTRVLGGALVFMFVGLIFALSTGVPCELKCMPISMVYGSFLLELASWWLTKFDVRFALLRSIGDGCLTLAFVFMSTVSMYEMWILPRRLPNFDRRQALTRCCVGHRSSLGDESKAGVDRKNGSPYS